jgi:hypothetical protein
MYSMRPRFFRIGKKTSNLNLIVFLVLLITSGTLAAEIKSTGYANAIGKWSGQDIIKVPVSWCVVRGSPSFEHPNIPNPPGGADQTTDDVLSRRDERTTDKIYINPAGIAFRSAINSAAHTSLHFPNIADPNSVGSPGNLTLSNLGDEYVQMLNECERAWENMTIDHSGVSIGIIAINLRLFVSGLGQEIDTIGIGKCTPDVSGLCNSSYDGHLAVVDNYFMIPGISSGRYNNDPFDQALGHELGHTLSLQHRNGDINALMNTNQQHNGPSGTVSNIWISDNEISNLRNSASVVPGIERDPTNQLIQGNTVQSLRVDNVHETKDLKPYEDISSVKVTLDKRENTSAFSQQLFGLLPEKIKGNLRYWTLIDLDNNKNSGSNATLMQRIGVPLTKFSGTDLVLLTEANGTNIMGNAWTIKGNTITAMPKNLIRSDIQTMTVHLDTAGMKRKKLNENQIPLYNSITSIINNAGNLVKLNNPISMQALIESNGTVVDRLDNETNNRGKTLELEQPFFPQCSINGNPTVGKIITVSATGLTPNNNVLALLGTRLVGSGTTGDKGDTQIRFEIPMDTNPGLHLITVGVDNTALEADCSLTVK